MSNPQFRRIALLLRNDRARMPCANKGKSSTTPPNRFYQCFAEQVRANQLPQTAMDDLEVLLASTLEKRRLTIDWRGNMLSHSQLIHATARRVGLVAPELPNMQLQEEKDRQK